MRLCLFLALPLAVALTACGGSHGSAARTRSTTLAHTELGQKACLVRVYFATHATHAQEQLVAAKLRQNPRVKRIEFTSKAQTLAEFKKQQPQIAAAIPKGVGNPLPDSYTVAPVTLPDLRQIHASIAGAQWRGVAHIKLDPCPRKP